MKPTVENPSQTKQPVRADVPPVKVEDPMEKWMRIGIRTALWVLLVFLVFAVMFSKSFTRTAGLQTDEAIDNAQLAYNVSQGNGFVTNVIRPLGLMFSADVQKHPDAVNPPLFPWILAQAFRMQGAYDQTVVLTSALFYFLLLPIVYLLGKRLFDARVANWSLLFCLFNAPLLAYSVRGVGLPLAAFLVALVAFILSFAKTKADEGTETAGNKSVGVTPGLAGAAGAVLGLASLAQYSLGLLALPVGVYLSRVSGKQRKVILGAFLVCFVVVIAPWLYRNQRVFHSPFFCLRNYEFMMGTSAYPGKSLYRRMESDLYTPIKFLTNLRGAPVGIAKKYFLAVESLYRQVPLLFNVLPMGFFLVSLFYPFQSHVVLRMRGAMLAMLVMLLIAVPLFDGSGGIDSGKALIPLMPVALIFAAAGFTRLVDEWLKQPFSRIVACVVTCFIISLPLVTTLMLQRRPADNPSLTMMESFRSHMNRDAVVVTNAPWEVAWVSRKKAILFPELPQSMDDIEQIIKPSKIDFIYLSPSIQRYPNLGGAFWSQLYLRPQPWGQFEVDPVTNSQVEILYRRAQGS
jgi:hypothetical protein